MRKSMIIPIIMIGMVFIPISLASADKVSFFIESQTTVHYHEPTESTTGEHHHLLVNNSFSALGYTYDSYVIEYARISLTITEVKNVGESLFFYLGGVQFVNDSHIGFAPFIFEAFYVERSVTFDYSNVEINPSKITTSDIVYFDKNGYGIGDIVIIYVIDGTVTHADSVFVTLNYYSEQYQVSESWIDDVSNFDSITDYVLCALLLPLILMSSSDELTFWFGVGFLLIEIAVVLGTIKVFIEGMIL